MTRFLLLAALTLFSYGQSMAFCGFYVAKADAKLFNKSSQVIMVRDGDHTVITMANDYQGSVKDFAMVVPVPEVLDESDIRVVQQQIFTKLDAYTAPRLAEYYDPAPCGSFEMYDTFTSAPLKPRALQPKAMEEAEEMGVKIEASYTVGEYDILILSAKESGGLKTWLVQNGYKLPSGAEEVLQPYINTGMKFFVVKVNLEQQSRNGFSALRPLQIQFNSSRFMLPIRLGMANAESVQDLVIYALTRKGRVETVNYRTTKVPTDRDIPQFVKTKGIFGEFYKAVYDRAWKYEGRNSVMLEYAWDISSQQPVKCDPCVTQPIYFSELREAGVWWISPQGNGYQGDLFITRLHARYSRDKFPQDLMFMATPNTTSFQGRYVIHNPAGGDMTCKEGKKYMEMLKMRKRREMQELNALTGWKTSSYNWYLGQGEEPDRISIPEPETAPEEMLGAAPVDEADESLSGADLEISADDFLKVARAEAEAPMADRSLLFSIAMLVFACGILYRIAGGKKQAD